MPRQTVFTETDKAAYWIAQAERCEAYASKCKVAETGKAWLEKAAEYRAHAATYSTLPAAEAA
jgi:hypothetical protein